MNLGITILMGCFAIALPFLETLTYLKVPDWLNITIILILWFSLSIFLTQTLFKKKFYKIQNET